jgi:ribose 5-phosphate isomerase B
MNIVIGNDHAAVELKDRIIKYCMAKGFKVTDLGVSAGEKADYPDKAEEVCKEYLKGRYDYAVLCCGTGIGISISANKIKGIRCALPQNKFAAQMAKEHNNANALAFGGRIEYPEPVEEILDAFFDNSFAGDRHTGRVEKINSLDGKSCC